MRRRRKALGRRWRPPAIEDAGKLMRARDGTLGCQGVLGTTVIRDVGAAFATKRGVGAHGGSGRNLGSPQGGPRSGSARAARGPCGAGALRAGGGAGGARADRRDRRLVGDADRWCRALYGAKVGWIRPSGFSDDLSPKTFTYGGTDYTVDVLGVRTPAAERSVIFGTTPDLPEGAPLVLRIPTPGPDGDDGLSGRGDRGLRAFGRGGTGGGACVERCAMGRRKLPGR